MERRRRDKHINVRPIERVYLGRVILALTIISWPYGSRVWLSRNEKRRNGISIRWKMTSYPPPTSPFVARSPTSNTYGRLPFLAWGFDPGAMSDRILQEPVARWVEPLGSSLIARFVFYLMSRSIVVAHTERTACPDDGISYLNALKCIVHADS